jgi:hypothetical protein
MAKLTGKISTIDLYTSTTDVPGAEYVGIRQNGLNGKEFCYALAGASPLVVGNLLQESAEDTTYENMTVGTAGAAGDAYLQITNGDATITDLMFRGGSIGIYTAGTNVVGDEYTIVGVTGTLTAGGALKVFLDRPLRTATTTGATVVMKRNPYSGVIQMPGSTPTGIAVGIAVYAIPAAAWGWVQTRGIASVLSDGSTFAVGSAVGTPSATAGAITVYAAATTKQAIGVAREAAASAKAISVNLTGF